MQPAQKICPNCQTVAPLEAAFCGGCGHQFRTQFSPQNPPISGGSGSGMFFAGVAVTLCVVFVVGGVLWLASRRPQTNPTAPPTTVPLVNHTLSAPQKPALSTERRPPIEESSDPIDREARRALERAKRDLDIPNSAAKDEEGRIRLRSGGAIRREDWDAARRKLEQSPLFNSPSTPPL